jgi:hypothetical protein
LRFVFLALSVTRIVARANTHRVLQALIRLTIGRIATRQAANRQATPG